MSLARIMTSLANILKGWDYYGRYERMYKLDLRAIPSFELILKLAHGKVLDVGCGIGYLSRLFGDYIGIDISREAITTAKKKTKCEYVIADATSLPFRSRTFDTCILYDVIEHIKNTDCVLAELRRVSNKAIISCADFGSYYRFFTYDEIHQRLLMPNELVEMSRKHFTHTRLFKTSGVFMAPRLVNTFLSKHFPNQIVLVASS